METNTIKTHLDTLVSFIKDSESIADQMYKENYINQHINDEYAYKFGVMVGRIKVITNEMGYYIDKLGNVENKM
jgi:hypothetical protein